MKLTISKREDGSYYTKIKNEYNGVKSEYYMNVQLPKGENVEFGTYDVACFLSCYNTKDGNSKPKIVVTEIKSKEPIKNKSQSEIIADVMTNEYEDFGKQVTIDDLDNLLD